VFWFAFFAFTAATAVLYTAAEWLPRHLRLFHYLSALVTALSSLSYLVLAGTYLGFVLVDGVPVYWVRYLDLALTVPLLLLALGLLSTTRLTETLFLSAVACVMSLTQLCNALYPGSNRYLFFALNLLLLIPPLSALTSGYRAQAAAKLGGAVATRVGICR
jgi:bacteriorhodopsin